LFAAGIGKLLQAFNQHCFGFVVLVELKKYRLEQRLAPPDKILGELGSHLALLGASSAQSASPLIQILNPDLLMQIRKAS